jgi:hypothetical protein
MSGWALCRPPPSPAQGPATPTARAIGRSLRHVQSRSAAPPLPVASGRLDGLHRLRSTLLRHALPEDCQIGHFAHRNPPPVAKCRTWTRPTGTPHFVLRVARKSRTPLSTRTRAPAGATATSDARATRAGGAGHPPVAPRAKVTRSSFSGARLPHALRGGPAGIAQQECVHRRRGKPVLRSPQSTGNSSFLATPRPAET